MNSWRNLFFIREKLHAADAILRRMRAVVVNIFIQTETQTTSCMRHLILLVAWHSTPILDKLQHLEVDSSVHLVHVIICVSQIQKEVARIALMSPKCIFSGMRQLDECPLALPQMQDPLLNQCQDDQHANLKGRI